jgi:hypothetical protein
MTKKIEVTRIIELGDLVKDSITGYEGIVVSYARYLYTCDRCIIQNTELDGNGKPRELEGFDLPQLQLVKKSVQDVIPLEEIIVQFNDYVKDKLSDFEGTVFALTSWINGCVRVGIVSSKLKKQEKCPSDDIWLPMKQVIVLNRNEVKVKEKKPGGPMPLPKGNRNPK